MPNRNGRLLPRSAVLASPLQVNITGGWVLNVVTWAAGALLIGGWVILPAKDSDLKLLRTEVALLREDFQAFALDVRGLRADSQRQREELIRLGVPSPQPPTASTEVPRRRKARNVSQANR